MAYIHLARLLADFSQAAVVSSVVVVVVAELLVEFVVEFVLSL
jgi:hypothetical protein